MHEAGPSRARNWNRFDQRNAYRTKVSMIECLTPGKTTPAAHPAKFHPAALIAISVLIACGAPSQAADYPNRPVRMVVPYPAGGPTDVIVRVAAQRLSEQLGQQIVVDNRAGASGMIGSELVARATPDGYTLLVNPSIHVILPSLVAKMPYDAVKDFSHITILASVPLLFLVAPSLPAKTVKEFIAYAKANPG
jgi:tripartite-type tricarboxylate transporter receptor subunit TctC